MLIVDDDRGFVQLVERVLQSTGQTLRLNHAYNGQDGLSAIRTCRPDLVLLDLIMPEVDGFQVLEAMRQDPELATIPVIVLTATSYAEDIWAQYGNEIVIHHARGLHPARVLKCLGAVIDVLEPDGDDQESAGPRGI